MTPTITLGQSTLAYAHKLNSAPYRHYESDKIFLEKWSVQDIKVLLERQTSSLLDSLYNCIPPPPTDLDASFSFSFS